MDLQDQLVAACEQGDDKAVLASLEKGAKSNMVNRESKKPLGAAIWGMNPAVVNTLIEHADREETITIWQECEEHNLKHYNGTFIVPKFEPTTYREWYNLLEKIDKYPFLQDYHLKMVDNYWHDSDSSNWDSWKKFVRRAGGKSFRGCTSFWGGGVNPKCTVATELGYAAFREKIQQKIEAVSLSTLGIRSS